jgi:hypothetical protein
MKKIKLFLFCLPLFCLLQSCDEQNNLVNLIRPKDASDQLILDTSYANATVPAAQLKNVLLEDFTAVHCDNCPNAQKRSIIIQNSNPGRVAVIGVHCTGLAVPGDKGFFDFRTAHGDDLITTLGSSPGLPIGAINRKLSVGTSILSTYPNWSTAVSNELAKVPVANIDTISKKYNATARVEAMTYKITFTQSVSVPYYFSVALIESGMQGHQQTTDNVIFPPDGVNDTFTFQHVLRKFMEPYSGLKLSDGPVKGMSYLVKVTVAIPTVSVPENCRIVAFVHQWDATNSKYDVEQVMETIVK